MFSGLGDFFSNFFSFICLFGCLCLIVLCFCVYILCLGGVFWLGFVRMPFSRRTGAGEWGPVTRKLFWSFCCTAHAWVIVSAHVPLVFA